VHEVEIRKHWRPSLVTMSAPWITMYWLPSKVRRVPVAYHGPPMARTPPAAHEKVPGMSWFGSPCSRTFWPSKRLKPPEAEVWPP
jgi:hypothetical protein